MENIDIILNSDFFINNILNIEEEEKELLETGWTREDIKGMAEYVNEKEKENALKI